MAAVGIGRFRLLFRRHDSAPLSKNQLAAMQVTAVDADPMLFAERKKGAREREPAVWHRREVRRSHSFDRFRLGPDIAALPLPAGRRHSDQLVITLAN